MEVANGMVKGERQQVKEGTGMLMGERAAGRGHGQTADPLRVRRLSGLGESCAALSTSPPIPSPPFPFSFPWHRQEAPSAGLPGVTWPLGVRQYWSRSEVNYSG